MAEEHTTFNLDRFLPYRLAVAAATVSNNLAGVYAERFGLTIPEWRVVANLGRHGALTAGDAAIHSSLDKVQVSRAIRRLQKRRLVSRRRGREDRREVHLSLTAEGTRIHHEIAALALAWEQELLTGLSPRDRAILDRCLDRLTARARPR